MGKRQQIWVKRTEEDRFENGREVIEGRKLSLKDFIKK